MKPRIKAIKKPIFINLASQIRVGTELSFAIFDITSSPSVFFLYYNQIKLADAI
ncbi:MAG: hypothetical protein CNLJKLNK_00755 [Holosporales bacterium]